MQAYVHELIPLCDARGKEEVGALYSTVTGLLTFIYPQFLSCTMEYITLLVVHCLCFRTEIHPHKSQNTTACLARPFIPTVVTEPM